MDHLENLDPRSYEAAVQRAVIHEAEMVVERAASGPTPMQQFTRSLFEQLRADNEDPDEEN